MYQSVNHFLTHVVAQHCLVVIRTIAKTKLTIVQNNTHISTPQQRELRVKISKNVKMLTAVICGFTNRLLKLF